MRLAQKRIEIIHKYLVYVRSENNIIMCSAIVVSDIVLYIPILNLIIVCTQMAVYYIFIGTD